MIQELAAIPNASEAEIMQYRVKMPAMAGVERIIPYLFYSGLATIMLDYMLGGGKRGHGFISYDIMIALLLTGSGLVLSAGIVWLLVDNYYVLDRKSGMILLHKGFRGFGKDTPLIKAEQVMAVGLNCTPLFNKGNQYGWRYKPMLFIRDSKPIILSAQDDKMAGEKLAEYNQNTRLYAAALGCYWIKCPANASFDLKAYYDDFRKGKIESAVK